MKKYTFIYSNGGAITYNYTLIGAIIKALCQNRHLGMTWANITEIHVTA